MKSSMNPHSGFEYGSVFVKLNIIQEISVSKDRKVYQFSFETLNLDKVFFHQGTSKSLTLAFVSFLFWNMFNKFKHLTLQNKQFFLLKNSLAHQYHNLCNVSKYAGIPKENFSIDLSVFRCINVHSLLCNAELIVGGVQS